LTLPVGYYSLLFRADTTLNPSTFLDNYADLLSFSCNFDKLTMCDKESGRPYIMSTHNFTVVTGDTVPNQELDPVRDHTSDSRFGRFIY